MKDIKNDKVAKRKGVTAVEVIAVILVVFLLAVGLAFSYVKFLNDSFENSVAANARKVLSAIQIVNVNVEELNASIELEESLENICPGLFGIGVEPTVSAGTVYLKVFGEDEASAVNVSVLEENSWGISDIKESGATFSFIYYHYVNGALYSLDLTDGIWGEVEVLVNNK